MPELPEIETIKLQLQKYLIGQTIDHLESLHPKSLIGNKTLIEKTKILGIERKGKMLILKLSKHLNIAIHFKMTGQLILVRSSKLEVRSRKNEILKQVQDDDRRIAGGHPTSDWVGEMPSKHTRVVFQFSDKSKLFFNDQRIFGWIKILNDEELEKLAFLKNLGKEPWDITDTEFFDLIHYKQRAIKLIIMDQEIISGVGNIYANDALWESKILPTSKAQSLAFEKAKLLREAIIKVLKEGIKYGGATAPDNKYVNLQGLGGKYQEHFRVYEREGKKCLRNDGGIIKKIKLGGRGTYFCNNCQK